MPNDFFATCERDEKGRCLSFHGTAASVAESVLKHGIKAMPTSSPGMGVVSLAMTAKDKEQAIGFALKSKHEGEIALVVVDAKAAKLEEHNVDYLSSRKAIPTKHIVRVEIYDAKEADAYTASMKPNRVLKPKRIVTNSLVNNVRNARVPARKLDPTRTGQLRRNFARQIKRKFRRLKGDLLKWLVVDDLLGMRRMTLNAPATRDFRFATSTAKLAEFKRWLRERFKGQLTSKTDAELWERFVRDGFSRGAGRAFDDVNGARKAAGVPMDQPRDEFLRSAFGRPETREKVELLASRSFEDLVNVTEDMATKMGRVLADGLVRGANPREVAKDLEDELDIGYKRAETIARTEIIRAHAEGQLDAFDRMGVEEIGVMVEWRTAGDDRVCPQCESMEGVVLRVDEAHGMIPAHPNCRCAFLPANLGEDRDDQVRGKAAIEKQLDEAGLEAEISKDRPRSLIGNEALNEFSRLVNAFDPDQPRDEDGRWSGDGSSGADRHSPYAHRPPKPGDDTGAPLHALADSGVFPDDFYSPKAAQYYGTGDPKLDKESIRILQSLKDQPDAEVKIYRAVPTNESGDFRDGDWVTVNPNYAKLHGEGPLSGDYKIIEKTVKAKQLYMNGDSIHEQGYWTTGITTPSE